jgi:hypothetical protein
MDAASMHPLLLVPFLLANVDCAAAEPSGPMLPLSLNLPNNKGQAYLAVPMTGPGMACEDAPPAPADVLRGEPGDLLRGPGRPTVRVEPVR